MPIQLDAEIDSSTQPNATAGLHPSRQKAFSATALGVKRAQDVTIAAIALLLFAPILALIALLIKLQDGGPVVYRRRVVGPQGEFDAYKFRSMRIDADIVLARNPGLRKEYEKNFKLLSDPRITPVGRWLRKLSLDELPQLFNVLKREMSLVGPRMITSPELAKYGAFQHLVLTVKPGLTGYWQVYGRQEVTYEDRVQMDVWYIQNWSLVLDLKLLLLTPIKIIKGVGAY